MKPILFNTDMVRAILSGQKAQTRRVVKLKYSNTHHEMRTDKYGTRLIEIQNEEPGVTTVKKPGRNHNTQTVACIGPQPPCRPGDILYVRETWNGVTTGNHTVGYWYKADDKDENPDDKWRPSIHMPKEAARIFLRVTDVREERLQEMTVRDLIAEGFASLADIPYSASERFDEFKTLWDSTIKTADLDRYGWDANPWVWVISFERCGKPEVAP